MTRLHDNHPRKNGWVRYLCNECGFRFWSQVALDAPSRMDKHSCADCNSADLHFTPGPNGRIESLEIAYHGDLYTRGEW